jgi:hypothetical protein
VKNMRELGCEAFLGEQDAEIAGRCLISWIFFSFSETLDI